MRIACLAACALLLLAGPAHAWVSLGETESTAYYLDPDTVKSEGERRRVWRLFDLKERQKNGIKSGKALIEIDCGASTYRYLRTMYYSDAMGKGKYLGGVRNQGREHIGPGSMIGQLARTVCDQPAQPAPAK
ncbi:MAG TPA: surface-adhesin E family protein [Ramlibacter sp.]|jgi:hypothetical protein|nr:surface-adhesin E family protein [Ramlibacter sp.]